MGGCNLLSITSGMSVGYMLADPDLDIQFREINLRISRRIRMRRLHINCYMNISTDERPVPVDCLTSNGTPSSSYGVANAGHAADLWIHWRKVLEEKTRADEPMLTCAMRQSQNRLNAHAVHLVCTCRDHLGRLRRGIHVIESRSRYRARHP